MHMLGSKVLGILPPILSFLFPGDPLESAPIQSRPRAQGGHQRRGGGHASEHEAGGDHAAGVRLRSEVTWTGSPGFKDAAYILTSCM